MEDLTGRHFGPYHIVAPLEEGGMAAVFKAYQPSMERHVAIKVLPRRLGSGPQFAGRFKQEALVLARLQHPHILPVFDYGEADGYTYLVMPLVESGTLKDLLRGQPLPLEKICDLISQLGDALDYAHAQNLVHRDVKPGNVLLDGRGNCLLTDFGIAKMVEGTSQFTATGNVVGTPDYMSPEQGRGDPVDARTDIYTLGVLLYEMATGRVPFKAETPVAVIFKHIQDPLPSPRELNPNLPDAVEAVIAKALAKEPQDRYATAGELVRALQEAIPAGATLAEERATELSGEGTVSKADVLPRQTPVAFSLEPEGRASKRAALGLGVLWAISGLALGIVLVMTLAFVSKYSWLRVPFASVFVFGLCALILALDRATFILWRRSRELGRELVELTRQPLEDDIPAIYGHKLVDHAEFLTIVQILFRHSFDARYIQVQPLPGGYGGSSNVLISLQRQRGEAALPRSFVVKLGRQSEMEDEYGKFLRYVPEDLGAAKFFRYAVWEESAGIAYEFVGLGPDHEIQSFYQFYRGYATVEVVELVGKIYQRLERVWYRKRRQERVDLCQEYRLLRQKRDQIIGHVAEIVEPDDPYRANFTAIEKSLQPNSKPGFCPGLDISWYDPVAFLRTWPRPNLELPVYRSTVHGDLHTRNVLVEIEKSGHKRVWFIDFSHTGNGISGERTRQALREELPITQDRGHVLRDFCRLEADVKFVLTRLQDEDDLEQAVAFEKALGECGMELYDLSVASPSIEVLQKERFRKAWQVVAEIRRQAAKHLVHVEDARAYYLSLLHATLPIVYYHPAQFENEACERQQKRYALLAAGMLCGQL